jgi:Tfp pilus assembly protein PilX
MDIKKNSILKNQSGVALVISMTMMIVLTLIAIASIFTSTTEIRISGRVRCLTDSFYSADSGVQVVMARVENFDINLYAGGPLILITDSNNPAIPLNTQVIITNDTTQEGAPRGYGFSAMNFEFEHFLVSSTAQTCANPIPSTTRVQEKLVRLIPTAQGGY